MANPLAGPARQAQENQLDWELLAGRLAEPGKLNLNGIDWRKIYQAGRITAGLSYLEGCDRVDFRGASMI